MEPVILDAPGGGELPPLRWRSVRRNLLIDELRDAFPEERTVGILVFGPPEWGVHVYLGRWLIGIERTREED